MESTGDTAAPAEQLDINDPNVQERLVNELKEQGIFDQLRKDCLSDVDTKPGYQNLKQRVDKTLDQFLKNRTWNPGLSKNQLRSQLRQQIEKISGKDKQIERLVDQIVDPRLSKALTPEVEAMLVKYFGSLDETNEEEDVEMSDAIGQNGTAVETESINSEPGLEGRMSPLTPENNGENNRSPGVEGNISPLTPSTTPPLPQQQLHPTVVNMEVEGQVELQESYTPPPKESPSYTPPPRQEESPSYTPPPPHIIPQPNTTTPPPGEDGGPTLPYSSPTKYPSQPPPPGESSAGSGEDASMSSISDTEMADVSPPRPSNRDDVSNEASDDGGHRSSPTHHIPLPDDSKSGSSARQMARASNSPPPPLGEAISSPDTHTPTRTDRETDRGGDSSEDLEALEEKKALLLAQFEQDFKLSPEEDSESDSEGEIDTEEDNLKGKTSPISSSGELGGPKSVEADKTEPEKSDEEKSAKIEDEDKKSSKSEKESSPENSPKQDEDPSGNDNKSDPEGNSDDSKKDEGEGGNEHTEDQGGEGPGNQDEQDPGADSHPDGQKSPGDDQSGGDGKDNRSPPPPATPPPPPSQESGQQDQVTEKKSSNQNTENPRSISPPNQLQTMRSLPLPRMEPEPPSIDASLPVPTGEVVKKGPVTPPEPFVSQGPSTPPEYNHQPMPTGHFIPAEFLDTPPKLQEEKNLAPQPASPPSPFSSFNPAFRRPPSPQGILQPQGLLMVDEKKSSKESKESKERKEKERQREKEREREKEKEKKKNEKLKEQKEKLAKVEQKVKSKDKLKSDKYQDLDIFSTTKKPVTPHQPYRPPTVSGTVTTPVTSGTPLSSKSSSSKRPELSKSVSRDSHSSSRTHNGDSSDKHSHKDKHKSSKESSSKTLSAAKIGDRRRSSDANSSSSRDHHHHDRKSGKSRESSRDRSETPRRHSQDKKELHKHSSNSERKDSKHKDNKEKDRTREKERERQKLKSRRESEDTKADAKESREKDRERFYEETKKKLAEHRKKEKEEKEKEKKEKKKSSNQSSSGASDKPDESLKEQLSSLDMEDIKKLLLRVATDKAAPANIAEEINKLHHEKDAKKSSKAETKTSSKKENDSKRKLVVIDSSDDNSDDIEVLNDTSHKKRDNSSTEKSSKVENEKSTKKVTAKDLNKTASGQSKSKTQEPPAKRRKLNISDSESSDSSSDEEETQNINQKKSASRQNVRKSAKPVADSDSDSSDPDDYKPDKSLVGKVESPAKKMKTRGVKVNLNRLSQNELDYLCDKEGDESSDSDFEVTVDHVEPASSEVIKVPDLKPTVKSPTRPPSTPGHNKTKSSTVKSPPKPSSPASTKIKSPAKIASQEKSTVDNVDGTPKVQKKKKVISSPDKNMAENKCEEKPKERKRSTKEMEENVTKTPKASIKPQVTKTPKSNKKIDTPKMVDTATNDNIVVENIDEIVGEPFFGFGEDCLEMVAQNRDNLAASFEDQNNIKIGEISEDRLAEFIPETKTITIDLPTDCDTTGLLANIDSSLGGGARTLAPIPQWLEPHIIGAKCKPEELEMPTEQEIADYLKKQQKKAKKRGCGYDIVVEWVPTKDPKQAKTKAERELRNDPCSAFFSGIEESGGKRTRRANNRYSSAEYSVGGLDTSGGNMETDAESSRPANNAEQIKIEDDVATQVDTPRVKSSKERINMYLRTAGIDRQLPDSTSNTLETTNNADDAIKVEEIKVKVNNTKTNEEEPTSTANVDSTEMLTETPEKMTRTRKRSGAAVSTSEVAENAPAALIENAANTPGTRATRKARRKSTSVKKEDHETVKCDIKSEDLTSTVETAVKNAKNDVDVELEQTESEMEKVLDSLKKRKRNGSGPAPVSQQQLKQPMLQQTEEFYGWPCETVTPLTAVSTCNLEADVLDKQGNTFGLLDIDVISKDIFCKETYDSNLEVIMSPALQKDLRILQKEQSRLRQMQPLSSPTKISSNSTSTTTTGPLSVEVKESVLLRPVKSQLDLRNGSDGSDSDDKGSISPVSSEVESAVARPTRKSLTGSAGDVSSSETPSAARPTRKRRASAANQPQDTITASASKRLRSK